MANCNCAAATTAAFVGAASRGGAAVGFGFLRDVALDQHLLERGRENEMFEVLRREPQLLGIGLNGHLGFMDEIEVLGPQRHTPTPLRKER